MRQSWTTIRHRWALRAHHCITVALEQFSAKGLGEKIGMVHFARHLFNIDGPIVALATDVSLRYTIVFSSRMVH